MIKETAVLTDIVIRVDRNFCELPDWNLDVADPLLQPLGPSEYLLSSLLKWSPVRGKVLVTLAEVYRQLRHRRLLILCFGLADLRAIQTQMGLEAFREVFKGVPVFGPKTVLHRTVRGHLMMPYLIEKESSIVLSWLEVTKEFSVLDLIFRLPAIKRK